MHSSCNHEPPSHHLRRLPCAILKFHLKAKRTRKSRTCKRISYIGSHILSPLYIPTVYLIHNCHPVDQNHFEFICKRLVFYVFFYLVHVWKLTHIFFMPSLQTVAWISNTKRYSTYESPSKKKSTQCQPAATWLAPQHRPPEGHGRRPGHIKARGSGVGSRSREPEGRW